MFISTMTHFLDPDGNIAKEMHKEGREHASFLALIVDEATKDYPPPKKYTDIRCLTKKCSGTIEIAVNTKEEVIGWHCTKCDEGGKILSWQGTKWDNRK